MTGRTPAVAHRKLEFTRIGSRRVEAAFDGGRLTTDAGLLLLREVDQQLGLTAAISDAVADPRDPRYIVHQQHKLIAQRV